MDPEASTSGFRKRFELRIWNLEFGIRREFRILDSKFPIHSLDRASAGSICLSRRAGSRLAAKLTPASVTATAANTARRADPRDTDYRRITEAASSGGSRRITPFTGVQKRATRCDRDASHQKLGAYAAAERVPPTITRASGHEGRPDSGADLPVQKRGLGSRTAASLVTRAVRRA